jgi:hypothetical protein
LNKFIKLIHIIIEGEKIMTCKNNKEKKIVCESCICEKSDNNKLKVTCKNCDDEKDITIICNECTCSSDNEVTLKKCTCQGNECETIYITCTDYKEDLS